MLVPLFVQIASFLFLVGLVVRCFTDDQVVGYLLLGFFIAGGVVYLIVSLLPFLAPSSPFRTPLSGMFASTKKVLTEPFLVLLSNASADEGDTDDNEVLGKILTCLLKSPMH